MLEEFTRERVLPVSPRHGERTVPWSTRPEQPFRTAALAQFAHVDLGEATGRCVSHRSAGAGVLGFPEGGHRLTGLELRMPFLADLLVSGPSLGPGAVEPVVVAVSAALAEGWQSRWSVRVEDDDDEFEPGVVPAVATGSVPDGDAGSHRVLDHRIAGFPGGVRVLVVLDGPGLSFEEALLSGAALGRHLIGWSPAMLEYGIERLAVTVLTGPPGEQDWLAALDDVEPGPDQARWPVAELMDRGLQSLAARYLLAGAVRSLWEPGRRVNESVLDAGGVAAGCVEEPWGRELTAALGGLLVRAARHEAQTAERRPVVVADAGERELAAQLLDRARATAAGRVVDDDDEEEVWDGEGYEQDWELEGAEEWEQDQALGYELLEQFMQEHDLTGTGPGTARRASRAGGARPSSCGACCGPG